MIRHGLAGAVALTLAGIGPAWADESTPRTLSISARGEVTAPPDMATLSIGITETERTAREAMQAVAQQMQAMFEVLAAAGVEQRDMQTQGLSLGPVWDYNRDNREDPRIVGYTASNTLTLRLRDLDGIGRVIDDLSAAGANQINAISFGIDDREALMEEARLEAAQNAKAKAQLYADALGETLGPVLSFSESGGRLAPQPIAMARMEAADSVAMPVAGGEVGLSVTVNVTFELRKPAN
ncbi:MAG: SIMPL domain-containing protein [Pseudomonadota bacterium]